MVRTRASCAGKHWLLTALDKREANMIMVMGYNTVVKKGMEVREEGVGRV